MSWSEGIPTVLALLIASSGAGLLAMAIARSLRLDRWLSRPFSRGDSSVHETIERLATLADVAREEGLLSAEGQIDAATDPILAEGLMLAVNGVAEAEIEDRLDAALEAQTTSRAFRRRWTGALMRCPALFVIAGAGIFLTLMLNHVSDPETTPRFAAAVGVLILLSLLALSASIPATTGSSSGSEASRLLCGLFQVLAAAMIRSGSNGRQVREQLRGYLPESQRGTPQLARAA